MVYCIALHLTKADFNFPTYAQDIVLAAESIDCHWAVGFNSAELETWTWTLSTLPLPEP